MDFDKLELFNSNSENDSIEFHDKNITEIEILCVEAKETFLELNPVGVLGEGGFGKAVLTVSKHSKRLYAVKIIPLVQQPENADEKLATEEYCELLRNELAVLSLTAQHKVPFCLSLVAFSFTESHLRIVTDYVNRGSLFDMIQNSRFGRLNQRLAKFYCAEIAIGLGYLHRLGVLHRDVCPSNVLVGKDFHLLICDFGFSIRAPSAEERVGAADYNAPEMLAQDVDYRETADWWSVGITWYTMLCGVNPVWLSNLRTKTNVARIARNRFKLPKVPESIAAKDKHANRFLQAILQHNPRRRLGRAGFKQVLRHPYLAEYSDYWKLIRKEVRPPLPVLKDDFSVWLNRVEPLDSDVQLQALANRMHFRKPDFVDFDHEIVTLV